MSLLRPRKKPTEQNKAEQFRAIARGTRASMLLKSDLWQKDIVTLLMEQKSSCKDQLPFKPLGDRPQFEAIALNAAYFSGKIDGLSVLETELNTWVTQGKEAHEKMEKEKTYERV